MENETRQLPPDPSATESIANKPEMQTGEPPQAAPTPEPQPKTKKRLLWILLGVGVLAAGLLAAFFAWRAHVTSPEYIFWKSFDKAFATKSVTQDTNSVYDIKILYSFEENRNPLTSTKATVGPFTIEGYGSLKNTYVKISEPPEYAKKTDRFTDKWTTGRVNGTAPAAYSNQDILVYTMEPRIMIFGDYIFANLPKKDRAKLVEYLKEKRVYGYDASSVKKATSSTGAAEWVYTVHLDSRALADYNKTVAPYFGLSSKEVDTDIINPPTKDIKWHIDSKTMRLTKVESPGGKATTIYSSYNATKLRAEPKANFTWQQLTAALQESNHAAAHENGTAQQ